MDAKTQFRHRSEPTLLADALVKMMEPRHTGISQRYEAASRLGEAWAQALPEEMVRRCRIVDLAAGLLTVEVDSPSYMYELRISSQQLVEHLRRECPEAKLRAIKITLAG
jgi:hypothetical protein